MSGVLGLLREAGLVPATGNPGKLEELRRLLQPLSITLVPPASLGVSLEPDETGGTFRENAEIKARAFYAATRRPVLSDDSGLCVDLLGGAPGVQSARYGGPGLSDADRRRRLLDELAGKAPPRRARFVCVLALMLGEGDVRFYEGTFEGEILMTERGAGGFGYDPVFLDPESGLSFGELSADEKNAKSHRGRALRALLADLTA